MAGSLNDLRRHNGAICRELFDALERVVDSGWFILGKEVRAFESEFAAYCGVPSCVGVANGTDALELALIATSVGPGKRVGTIANGGAYGTVAILAAGATPVYLDIDPKTLLVSEAALREVVSGRHLDAVIVTHLYGRLFDLRRIMPLARAAGVVIVEDCAQAHGAAIDGRRAGSFGDAGCFSFYPTKNLGALGDGGAVITSDPEVCERLKQLRQYGWSQKYHCMLPRGRNSRLDEMQAAVLRAKLCRLDEWNASRRKIAATYGRGIVNREVRCPEAAAEDYVAHLYVVRSPRRDALCTYLRERGVATDVHYPVPDYCQPGVRDRIGHAAPCPHTELACNEVLTLPCFPEMTDLEIQQVIDCVNDW